jgi:hypothetical protein
VGSGVVEEGLGGEGGIGVVGDLGGGLEGGEGIISGGNGRAYGVGGGVFNGCYSYLYIKKVCVLEIPALLGLLAVAKLFCSFYERAKVVMQSNNANEPAVVSNPCL